MDEMAKAKMLEKQASEVSSRDQLEKSKDDSEKLSHRSMIDSQRSLQNKSEMEQQDYQNAENDEPPSPIKLLKNQDFAKNETISERSNEDSINLSVNLSSRKSSRKSSQQKDSPQLSVADDHSEPDYSSHSN